MLDAELDLKFQGGAILAVFGVVAGDPPDESDVPLWNPRSPWSWSRFLPPVLSELLLSPLDNGLRLDDDHQ